MLATRGLTDEAIDVANEGLRRHPDSRPIRRGLASVLAWLGRMDEAERVVREAMAGNVPSVEEELTLGAVELARGNNQEADHLIGKALASGLGAWVDLNAAGYFLRANRPDRALAVVNDALAADPGCAAWLQDTQSPLIRTLRNDPAIAAVLRGAAPTR
jgi:predicted Zn-dependent protease